MAGSAGRANSGFDFASDDILCTYDDFANQDSSNGNHSDLIGANSSKDFNKTRMARSSAYSASSYNGPEDSVNPDMITIVERTMKKHNENIMRFLEGISSRLSQLELHCYNLDKSIGEMRFDLGRDHGEADTKLKTLEKHIQEVHRSVQILRDKQELADAQKELAKLQLVHKESSSSSHSQSEEKASPPAPDSKKPENIPEIHHNPLAIELPHRILPPPQPTPVPQPSQAPPQQQSYYQGQAHQGQYMTPEPQYQTPQAPQHVQTQISQTPQGPQFPTYQQQWPPQRPMMQPQLRSSSPSVYPTYPPQSQPANSSPPEPPLPNTMPLQVSYAAVPQVPYGYGPQGNYGAPQLGDGYPPAGPHSALPPGSSYMVYGNSEGGGRPSHHPPPQQSHYPPGGYPPAGSTNMLPRNPAPSSHHVRNHPYGEIVDKLMSMGFRGDHVMSVIQRMDESGQPVDFNAVLDRLSASSVGSQRGGWSG